MLRNSKKIPPKVIDFVLIACALFMIYPILFGAFMATYDVRSIIIRNDGNERHVRERALSLNRIRVFECEQHAEEILSAFKLELAAEETLYVRFFPGASRQNRILSVIVENVESVESLLSRFHGEAMQRELDLVNNPVLDPIYRRGTFAAYDTGIFTFETRPRDFHHHLAFFYNDEGRINAEFFVSMRTIPPEISGVIDTLNGYVPPFWLHDAVLVPLFFQIFLFAVVIFRIVHRKIKNRSSRGHQLT